MSRVVTESDVLNNFSLSKIPIISHFFDVQKLNIFLVCSNSKTPRGKHINKPYIKFQSIPNVKSIRKDCSK